MPKFKTVCGVIAFVMFFVMLGTVGADENDALPLLPGAVRILAALGLCFPTLPARSTIPRKGVNPVKYSAKTLTPVQVGQVVKALVLLGARKIIVEEVEKDRFVVTTTTEAAPSKKA